MVPALNLYYHAEFKKLAKFHKNTLQLKSTDLIAWLYPRGCRGSVIYTSLICSQDLWSTTFGKPPSDTSQDYVLIAASESDGSTVVEFSRDAVTGDNAKDVQFMVRSL